jgi:hypothetical protein
VITLSFGRRALKRKLATAASVALIVLISATVLTADNFYGNFSGNNQFYVGVEFAYGDQFGQVKALVDKVESYTNLIVLGSPALTFNRTALDQSTDYIYSSGLNFIVLITDSNMYNSSNGYPDGNSVFDWMGNASQKYGDRLLGIYRFDEPGGNQIDSGQYKLVKSADDYRQASADYVNNLSIFPNNYLKHTTRVFTADYGLYWFDYKSNYTTILAEFVGNQSRERIIALDRGAAESFGKDWGVIINWKYDVTPYLENGTELYSDLSRAYSAGAKYAVVFSYPIINGSDFGTLNEQHFEALQNFWYNIHHNPASFPQTQSTAAYVVPRDYGFGFRDSTDNLWGLFSPDNLSSKIWNDTTITLIPRYGASLNIIYDDPNLNSSSLNSYKQVYYWNQTIT